MPACQQRFELTFAWTGGCYLFIELALGVVRIVRHKVEPLAEFAHYERRCRAGSQLPTGPWLSASFATRTPGQEVMDRRPARWRRPRRIGDTSVLTYDCSLCIIFALL